MLGEEFKERAPQPVNAAILMACPSAAVLNVLGILLFRLLLQQDPTYRPKENATVSDLIGNVMNGRNTGSGRAGVFAKGHGIASAALNSLATAPLHAWYITYLSKVRRDGEDHVRGCTLVPYFRVLMILIASVFEWAKLNQPPAPDHLVVLGHRRNAFSGRCSAGFHRLA